MKKLILFTTVFVVMLSCSAQSIVYDITASPEQIVGDNYYIKDVNNQFSSVVGTWKWQDGISYFEITLQKFEMESYSSSSTKYYDHIYGKYKYVENGVVIAEVSQINPFPNFKLVFSFDTPTKYIIGINDVVSGKNKKGYFIIISPNTATLELKDIEGVNIGGYNSIIPFSLPISVTLTKQ